MFASLTSVLTLAQFFRGEEAAFLLGVDLAAFVEDFVAFLAAGAAFLVGRVTRLASFTLVAAFFRDTLGFACSRGNGQR